MDFDPRDYDSRDEDRFALLSVRDDEGDLGMAVFASTDKPPTIRAGSKDIDDFCSADDDGCIGTFTYSRHK